MRADGADMIGRGDLWKVLGTLGAAVLGQLAPAPAPAPDREPSPAPEGMAWHRVTLCSSIGPVQVDLPGPVNLDGPRDLQHLAAPTQGTFAGSLSGDDRFRFDAVVVDHAEQFGSTDAQVLEHVAYELDGDYPWVDLEPVVTVDQHVEAGYLEDFDGRMLHAHAVARGGVVVIVDVGVDEQALDEETEQARRYLDQIRASLDIGGLDGGPIEPCDGPSQEPL
jgi:hypothetical protein